MYVPRSDTMPADGYADFMQAFPFALLSSADPLQATHLPMQWVDEGEQGVLYTHMAKANTHWKSLDQQKALVVFSGPHAYISSSWYARQPSVPTWNYAALHAYVNVEVLSARQNAQITQQLLADYEPQMVESTSSEQAAYQERLNQAIVALKLTIYNIEAKQKLGHGRDEADQQGVLSALQNSDQPDVAHYLQFSQNWPHKQT